jgi:hypothetical protein
LTTSKPRAIDSMKSGSVSRRGIDHSLGRLAVSYDERSSSRGTRAPGSHRHGQ